MGQHRGSVDISGVNIPDELPVMNAKEYVDENHK
jgi:hypothetical protein